MIRAEQKTRQGDDARLPGTGGLDNELVSLLVHDLKAPLAVMMTCLEMLSGELDGHLDRHLRDILDAARWSGDEMQQLVDNILHVGRLEAGRLPVCAERVDIHHVVQKAVRQMRVLAKQRSVELDLHLAAGSLFAHADPHLTRRIVTNLLDNAVRLTPCGGQVVVSSQAQNGHLTLSVADDGNGIPAARHEQIQAWFDQGARGSQHGPTRAGFGLVFCKLAVEAQGGQIWVENAPGVGACFRFSLPAWQNGQRA